MAFHFDTAAALARIRQQKSRSCYFRYTCYS